MKKLLIITGIVLAAAIAWYLLSPLWRTLELNEASPAASGTDSAVLDAMNPVRRERFERAMAAAKEEGMQEEEPMPAGPAVLAEAAFVAKAHDVAGKALLIEHDGSTTLRFEDFETVNGPNLHIYLAADLEGKDYIDVGPIRATKGNVNYAIDPAINTAKYRHVLVWCVPFRVLFSSASLSSAAE